MKQLYSARNGLEAQDLRFFLEAHDIAAKVFGDNNALEAGFAFTPASAPGVFVDDADFERAAELLDEFHDRSFEQSIKGKWKCTTCGETSEAQFELCWKCESPRGNVAIELDGQRDKQRVVQRRRHRTRKKSPASNSSRQIATNTDWKQIGSVVTLAWLPNLGFVLAKASPWALSPWVVAGVSLWEILIHVLTLLLVMILIRRSGQPWTIYGFVRPAPALDIVLGILVVLLILIAARIVLEFATSIWNIYDVRRLNQPAVRFQRAVHGPEFVLMFVALMIGAIAEEVALRGFVLTTLAGKWNSWPKAVLVGSLLSLGYHVGLGWWALFSSLTVCMVLATSFAFGRRIWPLILAHATIVAVVQLR